MKLRLLLFIFIFLKGSETLLAQNHHQNWTGAIDTSFSNPGNWSSVDTIQNPDCYTDITIAPAANQPTISGNQNVGSIDIPVGTSLRIRSSATLFICGSLNNNGSLIVESGATIYFQEQNDQHLSGMLTGPNSLSNCIIDKPLGEVIMDTLVEIRNDLSIPVSTSVFNVNGKKLYLGGSLIGFIAPFSFKTVYNASHVCFNGSADQYLNNTLGMTWIDTVTIDKPAGKLYLNSVPTLMRTFKLNLFDGVIVTGNQEVDVRDNDTNAVTPGNINSYIIGNLRRKLDDGIPFQLPATFNFPVGDSLKGLELLSVTLKSPVIPNALVATFRSTWSPSISPSAIDCDNTYDQVIGLDQGYWRVLQDSGLAGLYEIGLHNYGYSNNLDVYCTVVVQDTGHVLPDPAGWHLEGVCVPGSNHQLTLRDSLTSYNWFYASAQGFLLNTSVSETGKQNCPGCGIYPNPVSDEQSPLLRFYSDHTSKATLQLFDLPGKLIREQCIDMQSGENNFPIETTDLSSGIYFLKLSSDKANFPPFELIRK